MTGYQSAGFHKGLQAGPKEGKERAGGGRGASSPVVGNPVRYLFL